MSYIFAQPNMNGGIDNTIVDVVSTVPSFIIGLLFFVWCVIFLGGMAAQRRRTGYSDAPQWAVMSSISTLLLSLILTLREGLINIEVLGIIVAVTIFAGLWFFMSKGRGEL